MINITDLLIIDHLISVSLTLPYIPPVFRHLKLFTILNLKLNKYNLLPNVVSKNSWMSGKQCRPAMPHLGLHCLLRPVRSNTYSKEQHIVRIMLRQVKL